MLRSEPRQSQAVAKLQSVADQRGIAVTFAKLSGGLFGVSKGGTVDVDDSHATGQQAKTLAHEFAHEPDGIDT